nr:winged helix-turn-helix domain-containing protein [Nocardioides flavescens]
MPLPTETPLGKRAAPVPVDSTPTAPQPSYAPPVPVSTPQPTPQPTAQPTAQPEPEPAAQPAPRPAPQPTVVPTLAEPAVATAPTDPIPGGVLTLGDITLDSTTGRATYQGQLLDLTSAEFDLLSTLMRTGRRVRSKADLVLALRGHSTSTHFVNEADKRTVDHHVAALKLKLRDEGRLIETVRGVGYRLAG